MAKVKPEKKEYEYDEAPSGFIWIYNAKEPLMKFEGGFGFDGVLALDGNDDKVQCHFCGQWFGALHNHLAREHAMSVAEYKELTGLNSKTALISEKFRESLVRSGMKKRMKNLRPNKGHTAQTKAKIRATLQQNRMAIKNQRGTCPEQLIDRLIRLKEKLGRTPRHHEVPFMDSLKRTYGTYKEACRVANIAYVPVGYHSIPASKRKKPKYTKKDYIEFIETYYLRYREMPNAKHFRLADKTDLYKYADHKGWDRKEMERQAMVKTGLYTHIKKPTHAKGTKPVVRTMKYGKKVTQPNRLTMYRFTDRELLVFLKRFEQIHGRKPSASDAKRNLVPAPATYANRFGSWKNALRLAGVTQ